MAAYAAAIAGAPLPIGLGRAESGSVNAAVLSYLASNLFKALKSPETKKVHRATLERFAAKYGSLSFRTLDKIGVERVLAKIAETPGAARNLRNVLRRMMKWAVAEGILASNPTEGIKVVMPKSDGWHTMTDAEREQYRTHHPIGTKARAAFELFFYTALRCSDACRLGPQHIVGSTLRLKQQKTGELVELPVGQETVDNVAPSPSS